MIEILMNQPWYAIAGEIVLFANSVTLAIPNAWAEKIPGLNYLVKVLDWLSLNIFANKNVGAK